MRRNHPESQIIGDPANHVQTRSSLKGRAFPIFIGKQATKGNNEIQTHNRKLILTASTTGSSHALFIIFRKQYILTISQRGSNF